MGWLPKLYTSKEYAASIGKSHSTVKQWLKDGLIPDAQYVGKRWVVPKNAKIRIKGTDIDVPPALLFEINPYDPPVYKEPQGYNKNPVGAKKVELPGYAKVIEDRGLTRRQVQAMSGVHHNAQKKAHEGKKVTVKVAWKLAKGLNVSIETLLRKPWM